MDASGAISWQRSQPQAPSPEPRCRPRAQCQQLAEHHRGGQRGLLSSAGITGSTLTINNTATPGTSPRCQRVCSFGLLTSLFRPCKVFLIRQGTPATKLLKPWPALWPPTLTMKSQKPRPERWPLVAAACASNAASERTTACCQPLCNAASKRPTACRRPLARLQSRSPARRLLSTKEPAAS